MPWTVHRTLHLLRGQPLTGPRAARHPAQGKLAPAAGSSNGHTRGGRACTGSAVPALRQARPGRDVRFRGLLAPGSDRAERGGEPGRGMADHTGERFQNYRARFTVLDAPAVSRAWIDQLTAGDPLGSHCPPAWRSWVDTGTYTPLLAPPTVIIRSREQQQPLPADRPLLDLVYLHFKDRPHDFEQFAADLWRISQPNVDRIDVTRPWRDGGRDAVGDYLLGPRSDPVAVEFALEAKCYGPANSVGVREASRLHLTATAPPVRRPGHHLIPARPGLPGNPRGRAPRRHPGRTGSHPHPQGQRSGRPCSDPPPPRRELPASRLNDSFTRSRRLAGLRDHSQPRRRFAQ